LGNDFDLSLDEVKWPQLQSLTLGECFNSSLKGTNLPGSLKSFQG
jgi:hypothetical protein